MQRKKNMARILSSFYALIMFLFLIFVNAEERIPCLWSLECPKDMCPTKYIPKCINLSCQCHFEK
uniref:Nodule-specific cysteine-rich peptide L29 n=1 Tax=Lens culinaris TaxID=3864 RepID=A0A7T8IG26_LENCU|nr:nodule-specific cysteine-rich peptide L29 [Lens culinaris]